MTGRLHAWIQRLNRTAEAIEWFGRKVVPAGLFMLCGVGLVWYSALEFLTPNPWSGPDAVSDTFGWQVWTAGAVGITGLVGLLLIEYIRLGLVAPVAVLSWILARFQPDDPVRRQVTGLPERVGAVPWRVHTDLARPAYTRADLIAPLHAAVHRPATWLITVGGIVLAMVLVVGVSTLLGAADRRTTVVSPSTAVEKVAMEEQLRAKAAEVHAIIGIPPIHEDLRLVGTQCHRGDRRPGDPSRSGFGYLGTQPGMDLADRMPQWAVNLRVRGWAVTHPYPIESRSGVTLDNRILRAVHDGFEVTIDAHDPPDLWIEVRGLC